ncbi:MAG: polyhydroxyalkanoate synthesis regulator DNA-binding domain-containing protein [Armatimonadota bacterium]|nr:polyhydroxyalkanoate synthesis regulator DNA-binding domain-containing protein [Armatimonadota bacterium]MDR7492276.1 polyhydroxyalkanoate synthesis regulator DNA-binding domain-containing protein [Armatimonadota bacterium]MDR7593216.1 polyhydroxyalkanoate synthesis regulator DNA-binding domain-containing protein [Armatimonadota bacterium]
MDEVLIRRYANRKLYDQSRSRYVTLEDLAELIRQGRRIRVQDAETGEDLTSQTLAQILLERERERRSALPVSFLHQLIRHGEAWQDFLQESLRASLEGVVATQREAERIFREWGTRAGWWSDPGRVPTSAGQPAGTARDELEALRAELAALKARLQELEARLGG